MTTMGTASSGRTGWAGSLAAAAAIGVGACSDSTQPGLDELTCSIPASQIFDGGPGKDGIPALTDPTMVGVDEAGTEYLRAGDRVVGIALDGQVLAIPLNIFWWHEIVNLRIGDRDLAITHCPLTGSSLAFDRAAIGGAELGVSGLLFRNNLVMYDRTGEESLWPQMLRGARCGPRDGAQLTMVPVLEMLWDGWRSLHPDTRVVSSNTGFGRDYTFYPYGNYDRPENSQLLFPMPAFDTSRPPKERVLGIPEGAGGLGFPFGLLEELGPVAVVETSARGREIVVFWDAASRAAMAYDPGLDGVSLTFAVENGRIVDNETGTHWRVDGVAVDGELASHRLEPIAEAFISFWFAWTSFHPDADVWGGP
jgi:hypothetical protein